jgi:hypothetical protein
VKRVIHSFLPIVLLAVVVSGSVAQNTVEERSTGVRFPETVSFQHGDDEYTLQITGVALRKKFFVKVYGIAHYWNAGSAGIHDKDDAFAAALSDEYAKQITMEFVRDVEAKKIEDAFREGFKKMASKEEWTEISSLVDRFLANFHGGAEPGKRYVLRWLPGGIVTAFIHGEESDPIESVTFATALWRIWLAKGSIVDRERLVEMAVTGDR